MKLFSKNISLGAFAAWISHHLTKEGIDLVLTGGAVVSIYTNNKYQSNDADFISGSSHKKIDSALKALGFKKEGREYAHPDCQFYVEFPPGPLAVGDLLIKPEAEVKISGHRLILLSPTQSVMDRLAGFFHWNDRQSLDQALWIAEKHPIRIALIKKWAESEGAKEKFQEFFKAYKEIHLKSERKPRRRRS